MAETALQRAERQYKEAKARLDAARAREATAERKRDTRRKVILGGALIDLASRDDRALEMLNRLIDNLPRERDRASFEGWARPRGECPRAEVAGSAVGTGGAAHPGDGAARPALSGHGSAAANGGAPA